MITVEKIEIDENCVVQTRDKDIDYIQLNKNVKIISNKFKDIEGPVALFFEHNEYYIMSALAAIKEGVTFVPINTKDPIDRIEYIFNKCNLNTILCCKGQEKILNEQFRKYKIIFVEDILNSLDVAEEKEEKSLKHQDTMYILFTSGSTGQPKGVEVTRGNFIAFAHGICESIEFKQGESILFHTNIAFDIHLLETIVALCVGLRVVLLDENECDNIRVMKKVITEKCINILQITPSKLQLMLNDDPSVCFLKIVNKLLVGGEVFSVRLHDELVKMGKRQNANLKIYNVYGPTETTIWSTVSDLTEVKDITIGRPIHSAEVYVLDERKKIINEANKEGEIFIAGKVVAKGYINDSLLTNRKFITIRTCDQKETRGFLTGDIGKWNQEGNLICLGRKDNMVKINGHRIELEEIETVIAKLVKNNGTYVVMKYQHDDTSSLVAFYNQKEADIEGLKELLRQKLPEYMVPNIFLYVNAIPYTASFKIDKNRLLKYMTDKIQLSTSESIAEDNGDELLDIIKNSTAINNIEIVNEKKLNELGINSIMFIKIIVAIEKKYAIEFDDEKLNINAFKDYEDLKQYVISKRGAQEKNE